MAWCAERRTRASPPCRGGDGDTDHSRCARSLWVSREQRAGCETAPHVRDRGAPREQRPVRRRLRPRRSRGAPSATGGAGHVHGRPHRPRARTRARPRRCPRTAQRGRAGHRRRRPLARHLAAHARDTRGDGGPAHQMRHARARRERTRAAHRGRRRHATQRQRALRRVHRPGDERARVGGAAPARHRSSSTATESGGSCTRWRPVACARSTDRRRARREN